MKRIMIFFSITAIAILFAIGWYFARDRLMLRAEYRLSPEKIELTPPPEWVPSDFAERVIDNFGLDTPGLLLDSELSQKLAHIFSSLPWVEKVERVEVRYPSGAKIDLKYRVPVAFVDINGLLPIDRNGVLLPTEYFLASKDTAKYPNKYPKIMGIRSSPLGGAGTLWGDPLVSAAATLASVLSDEVPELRISQIVPSLESSQTEKYISCKLQTENGVEIFWGNTQEPIENLTKKIERLQELVKHQKIFASTNSGVKENQSPINLDAIVGEK